MSGAHIAPLAATAGLVEALSALLIEATANGASMSFMHPLPRETARAFWRASLASAETGGRAVLGAWDGERLVGSVTVIFDLPPNQPHRAEVAKMVVALDCRRKGLGAALMAAAEEAARARGRSLLVLDTVPGSDGARLYARMGWTPIGRIPDYALAPHGGLTEFYYKRVSPL